MERKELTSRIAGWALQLQEYDFKLEHRSGSQMKHVDALSRDPFVLSIESNVINQIKAAQRDDVDLKAIFELLKNGDYDVYINNNGCLFKVKQGVRLLVVPRKMMNDVIKMCHEQGHFGLKKTEELVKRQFYIQNLASRIKSVLKNCIPCIMTERKMGKKDGFLHPIPKGDLPLNTYHIDHLGSLVATKKHYKYIFCVIDAFSKFVWVYPTKTMNVTEVVQKLEFQKSIFGNPRNIIADRGGAFRSEEFKDYCKNEHINLMMITTGVPTGNGQVERVFRTIIPALTKLSLDEPESWFKYTDKLQRCLNNTYQRSIGMSPFELLMGVKMRMPEDVKIVEVIEREMARIFIDDREVLREEAKKHIQTIQDENCRNFNKRRKKAFEYRKGDLVLIKRTQFSAATKLQPKFLGPYEIINVNRNERYDVKKIGNSEGPVLTSTCAEYMKPYYTGVSDDDSEVDNDPGNNEDLKDVDNDVVYHEADCDVNLDFSDTGFAGF